LKRGIWSVDEDSVWVGHTVERVEHRLDAGVAVLDLGHYLVVLPVPMVSRFKINPRLVQMNEAAADGLSVCRRHAKPGFGHNPQFMGVGGRWDDSTSRVRSR
jgi:hypothetical protein